MPSSFPLFAMSVIFIKNFQIESDAFCASGVVLRGGVRKAGFKGVGWVKLSFSGFCKIAACANLKARYLF